MLSPFLATYDWQNQSQQGWFKFCPRCGTQLNLQEIDSHPRPACPSCGFIQFRNPFPTIAVYIVDQERILLGQRTGEPGAGLWATPSGYIEYNEDFISAAVREAREETGLEVQIQSILHVESAFLAPQYHFLTIYLLARVISGNLTCTEEHSALSWFPLAGSLPPMAFATDAAVIGRLADGELQGIPLPTT
jgi:ADP-ribose pyrophosphatase YjhB (NUDIX family)